MYSCGIGCFFYIFLIISNKTKYDYNLTIMKSPKSATDNRLNEDFALWRWIFIVLVHWNNSPRVDMSLHSSTLFWFRANQSLLFLLNAACLAEKQEIPILYSLVWPDRGSKSTIYPTRGKHTNHYATDAVLTSWQILQRFVGCRLIKNKNACGGHVLRDKKNKRSIF
jgi:hypothetical protein